MKDWVEQARAEGWVIADITSCPGYDSATNTCQCPCFGCKHHCSAHNPATIQDGEPAGE